MTEILPFVPLGEFRQNKMNRQVLTELAGCFR